MPLQMAQAPRMPETKIAGRCQLWARSARTSRAAPTTHWPTPKTSEMARERVDADVVEAAIAMVVFTEAYSPLGPIAVKVVPGRVLAQSGTIRGSGCARRLAQEDTGTRGRGLTR